MLKYLQITTGDGVELIAADDILYCESGSSTAVKMALKGGASHILVTGTGLTSGFAEAVHAALQVAGETNWMKTTSVVELPIGVVVTSLAVTAGV
tara:strand:+ start:3316 stop:3600 length:285 start_codon:yes stop_codon:yes gene_type:complete